MTTDNSIYNFYSTCPRNCEELLKDEIEKIGASNIKISVQSLFFSCSIKKAYRICLSSRIASHIILILKEDKVEDKNSLYNFASSIKWREHFSSENTISIVSAIAGNNKTLIKNSNYASMLVKDAICDYFNSIENNRPNIEKNNPEIVIKLLIRDRNAILGLDLSGYTLQKRGYKTGFVAAPLKENAAYAMIMRSQLLKIKPKTVVDPMCGGGTILIETAMLCANIPASIFRVDKDNGFGFLKWKKHNKQIWQKVIEEEKKKIDYSKIPKIIGFDINQYAIESAKENIENANLLEYIEVKHRDCLNIKDNEFLNAFLLTNLPYGERLGTIKETQILYQDFGAMIKRAFGGGNCAILTGSKELATHLGIKAKKINKFYNGKIETALLVSSIFSKENIETMTKDKMSKIEHILNGDISEGSKMFVNRLKKNTKNLKSWLKTSGNTSYRIYDADMPEYSAAIDIYQTIAGNKKIHLSEYQPPKTVNEASRKKHFEEIIEGLIYFYQIKDNELFIKTRLKQKGLAQYEKRGDKGEVYIIQENNLKFCVNLKDYLDTWIFLDHRITRNKIKEISKNKTFLNLFSYTATATTYATAGGAKKTVSVDKSNTYLEIAKDNLKINNLLSEKHQFIKDDCINYLKNCKEKFDIIFMDPPTFSNSKSLRADFDIQKQHKEMIKLCLNILNKDGLLIFSNNYKKFKFDESIKEFAKVEEISEKTIDQDFKRNSKIHRCWEIRKK